ncbi:response regulator [uncultured Sphingomonas sp.]|uniref:response regulator n=1 Tax=uncultured Sphingomonas sp. TaxID=158754 RepID=UPI0025CE5FF3|nr:response regulator [uncultured Sphingomonas sp.]
MLIVEDDYFIASDLADGFAEAGFVIEGPVPSLAEALAVAERGQVGGALLDIDLNGEKVWEVADALIERGIPVVFVTGYDRESIPDRYLDVPLCLKPIDTAKVVDALARVTGL